MEGFEMFRYFVVFGYYKVGWKDGLVFRRLYKLYDNIMIDDKTVI